MRILLLVAFAAAVACPMQAQTFRVYFTKSVDNTVSPIADAQCSPALDDTVIAFINSATAFLDIAVWDNGSTSIVNAINNAYLRGVQVRYISSTNSTNSALSGMNANIPLLKRTSTLTSNVMHNKFVVVDNSRLLTGSMNFGNGSMHDDYNNILFIDDATLAQNYVTEFNEMWGSNGAQPNLSLSKFGPAKTDNTIHNFTVSGVPVQSYFSPTDGSTAQIVNAINTADHTLDIAMFTFINNDLGDAVVAAKNRGVAVRCIMENASYFGSEYNSLLSNGISVISHESIPYDFHHKYCIIDAMYPSSDPMIVTGSHNWTNSAEDEYDENTLIIHSETIANIYTEEFEKRVDELTVGLKDLSGKKQPLLFPNPNCGVFSLIRDGFYVTDIIDGGGNSVYKFPEDGKQKINKVVLPPGIYQVRISGPEGTFVEKMVIN